MKEPTPVNSCRSRILQADLCREAEAALSATSALEHTMHLFQRLAAASGSTTSEASVAKFVARRGSAASCLAAKPRTLARFFGEDDNLVALVPIIRELMIEALRGQVVGTGIKITDMPTLLDYVRLKLADEPLEQVLIFYLDSHMTVIDEERLALGSLDGPSLHPRTVASRALETQTSGIILVHNHPSGDLEPSRTDISTTRRIVDVTRALGIGVHDHIIITRNGFCSLRTRGLL